jgi:hypothetical protein
VAQFRKDTSRYLADSKTIFEVVMLADQYGNLVGPANPSGTAVDAFGRARISNPVTLFDSANRFFDNSRTSISNNAGGTTSFAANTSTLDMNVSTASGVFVYRETNRVFAYQPGKSLQILQTFVMNPAKAGLRQRVGYFGANNGFFLERTGASTVQFVRRSRATGAVVDTPITQANWNLDKMDGTGPSALTLNLDNPQIMFTDIEWLGVGSVRMGFVINGKLIPCHTFNHANLSDSVKGAYMQTACLPLRYEIENTATTASASTFKVVCATVISEGGYELRGRQRTIGTPITTPYAMAVAGTYYPVASLRLNTAGGYTDGIATLRNMSVSPISAGYYNWKIVSGGTVTGGTWANTDTSSIVEYNITATSFTATGSTDLASGYISTTQQSGAAIQLQGDIFTYQLERNSFTNTPTTLTLLLTSSAATTTGYTSLDWQEIT